MSHYKIVSRWDANKIIYEGEAESLKDLVTLAVENGASLRNASLDGASLRNASLRNASLDGASLRNASLDGASLDGASLRNASLDGASLRNASLYGASLRNASLRNASLDGASLRNASLDGASLRNASLDPIKADFFMVLLDAIPEIAGLRTALTEGKVDGSTYTGECACLVGTIANVRHCNYNSLGDLKPDSNRPIERFFCGIGKGDTPETSQFSKIAVDWIDEFNRKISLHTSVVTE